MCQCFTEDLRMPVEDVVSLQRRFDEAVHSIPMPSLCSAWKCRKLGSREHEQALQPRISPGGWRAGRAVPQHHRLP